MRLATTPISQQLSDVGRELSSAEFWENLAGSAVSIAVLKGAAGATAKTGVAVENTTTSTARGVQTTLHGAERVAGITATRGGVLSIEGINATKTLGKAFTQADGATVFLHEVTPGRFNAVVQGNKGIITTMENWSQKSINRIAKNYGWKLEK